MKQWKNLTKCQKYSHGSYITKSCRSGKASKKKTRNFCQRHRSRQLSLFTYHLLTQSFPYPPTCHCASSCCIRLQPFQYVSIERTLTKHPHPQHPLKHLGRECFWQILIGFCWKQTMLQDTGRTITKPRETYELFFDILHFFQVENPNKKCLLFLRNVNFRLEMCGKSVVSIRIFFCVEQKSFDWWLPQAKREFR